jgi:hypothetical protein
MFASYTWADLLHRAPGGHLKLSTRGEVITTLTFATVAFSVFLRADDDSDIAQVRATI